MANIWFISDTHFGDADFMTFLDNDGRRVRDFTSVDEMNECMVTMWNQTVGVHDKVYHLGDVCQGHIRQYDAIMRSLHGKKRLLRGNHDNEPTKEYLRYFKEIHGCRVFPESNRLCMTHVPIHPSCLGRYGANVHGHIHTHVLGAPYINICVEQVNYTPVNLDQLVAWSRS